MKSVTSHILRQDSLDFINDFDKEIKKITDKAIDASVEAIIKDHIKANESLLALQNILKSIAKEKPIIIFIDELDRCKPSFSVSMLEIIKHTFDVKGVKFVLITNTEQLKASIKHCYGSDVDAHRYLDKFVKYSFTLSEKFWFTSHQEKHTSIFHYQQSIGESEILQSFQLDQGRTLDLVSDIIKTLDLSLREVETLVLYLEIYQVLAESKRFQSNPGVGVVVTKILGVILFLFSPTLALQLKNGSARAIDLARFLGVVEIPNYQGGTPRPNNLEIMTYVIGTQLKNKKDVFHNIAEEDRGNWEDLRELYFSDSFSILQDVVYILSLNTQN